jgi:hypothetical protein
LFDLGFPTFIPEIFEAFDEFDVLPCSSHRLLDRLMAIGERDHAHDLWEVGVAGRSNQEPIRLVTWFLGVRPEPGTRAIAQPKRTLLLKRGLGHAAVGMAALAANPDLGKITTRPPLVDPQLPTLSRAIALTAVHEIIPVNVPNVAVAAGAHEPDRHDGSLLSVPVEKPSLGQGLAVDQQPRAL